MWPQELSDIKSEEAFQEKYAKFNEEINAQEKTVNETLNLAENLLQNKHPESDLIMRRREVTYSLSTEFPAATCRMHCTLSVPATKWNPNFILQRD